jgi:stearoyl-CoA desaturase (delta-9 desaturase)
MVLKKLKSLPFLYAVFVVYLAPLAIPLCGWTLYKQYVTSSHLFVFFLFYILSGLGITLGYHRLITHRSYTAKPWLKRLLLIFASFAMQGSPALWTAIHLKHHRYADKPEDPHSPHVSGFWEAHCGWIFREHKFDFRRPWLLKDKEVRHVSKYYVYYSNLGLIIPFLLGGWVGLLWGGLLRILITNHLTWSVNSLCHFWGKRAYPTINDQSTNNFLIALLTFGEGWHNNHHRFLQKPFFGHKWYQIDFGKWVLLSFARLGWVSELKN